MKKRLTVLESFYHHTSLLLVLVEIVDLEEPEERRAAWVERELQEKKGTQGKRIYRAEKSQE